MMRKNLVVAVVAALCLAQLPAFAGIAPSPFRLQGMIIDPATRGKLQILLDTIKNIRQEIDAARVKLNGAKEGDNLTAITYGCKSLPAIEGRMNGLSESVRSAAPEALANHLAAVWSSFDALKAPMKANQRGVSLERLTAFEQSIKAMAGAVAGALAPPAAR
jgi:hypothetical protein